MFSEIDKTIFPDSCEVLEITPSQHYVFPIFKCGKSSLYDSIHAKNWKIIVDDEIQKIQTPITVYLRNPKSRFISGVNTYLQHIKRNFSEIDDKTALWFIDQYLFLNRHYCPQFFWILNLSKFVNSNTKLYLCDYRDISKLTQIYSSAGVNPVTEDFLQLVEKFDWKRIELYLYLDQILVDRLGQSFTIQELIDIVYYQYPDVYKLIFNSTLELFKHVLPST